MRVYDYTARMVYLIFLLLIFFVLGCEIDNQKSSDNTLPPSIPKFDVIDIKFDVFDTDLSKTTRLPYKHSSLVTWGSMIVAEEFEGSAGEQPNEAVSHYSEYSANLISLSQFWLYQFFSQNSENEWSDGKFDGTQWEWNYEWKIQGNEATISVIAEPSEDGWKWYHYITDTNTGLENFLWSTTYQSDSENTGQFKLYNPELSDEIPAISLEFQNINERTEYLRIDKNMPDGNSFGIRVDRPDYVHKLNKEFWIEDTHGRVQLDISLDFELRAVCINDHCWTTPATTPADFIGPPAQCGEEFTVTHEAGDIAPETVTITYGTVLYDGLCWTTQNLGAEKRPESYDDGRRETRGWIWQFNRLQGHKYIGSEFSLIPDTPMEDDIPEESNWILENDPCSKLLGGNWRIPSSEDWPLSSLSFNWLEPESMFRYPLYLHQNYDRILATSDQIEYREGHFSALVYSRYLGNYFPTIGYPKTNANHLRCVRNTFNQLGRIID